MYIHYIHYIHYINYRIQVCVGGPQGFETRFKLKRVFNLVKNLKKLRMRIKNLSPLSKLALSILVICYLGYGLYFNIVNFTWFNAIEWFAIIIFFLWRKYAKNPRDS